MHVERVREMVGLMVKDKRAMNTLYEALEKRFKAAKPEPKAAPKLEPVAAAPKPKTKVEDSDQ